MKKIFALGILMLLMLLAAGFVSAAVPVLSSIGDKDAFEDTELKFTVTATDVELANVTGHTLTLTQTGLAGAVITAQPISDTTASWIVSWTSDNLGENVAIFTVKDNDAQVNSASENITITVFPQLCEDGEVGDDLEISDLDLDEDEYFIGDKISLDVDVDNDGTKDLDVNVEAFLYDVRQEDKLDDFDSDTTEIKDGDTELFEIELEFPFDNDLDEDDDFIIFVKAFEDGDEDTNCVQDMIDVDFERDDNDVVIEDVRVNPEVINPGENIEVAVDVLNVGNDDQDDASIEVINSQLRISQKSSKFDIERAGDDDSMTSRFTVKIPENAAVGDYTLTVRVLDEDEDAYDRGEEFVTITVSGQAEPEASSGSIEISQRSFNVDAGTSFTMPVTISNPSGSRATYTLAVTPVGSWASSVSQIVSVEANSQSSLNVVLNAKSDAEAGSYTALVELKSGAETLASNTINVNVDSQTGLEPVTGGTVFRPVTDSNTVATVFWIIGDVALIVIIIYFITLLFRKRKK